MYAKLHVCPNSLLVYQPISRILLRISFAVLGIVVFTQDFRKEGSDTKVSYAAVSDVTVDCTKS